jgi:hypothetical protein
LIDLLRREGLRNCEEVASSGAIFCASGRGRRAQAYSDCAGGFVLAPFEEVDWGVVDADVFSRDGSLAGKYFLCSGGLSFETQNRRSGYQVAASACMARTSTGL